jgi:putative transposase
LTRMGCFGKVVAMPRTARVAPGDMVFHVLNRGVGRMKIFRAEKDFLAFQRVVEQTLRVAPVRICQLASDGSRA